MSKRKRQQLKKRKEISKAIEERNLIRQFSTEVMTRSKSEIRKSKTRLKLPDMADLSSPGSLYIESSF